MESPSYLATLETVAGLRQCGGNPQDCTPPPSPPNDGVEDNKNESSKSSQVHSDVTSAVSTFLHARCTQLQNCWQWAKSRSRRSQGLIFLTMIVGFALVAAILAIMPKTGRGSGTNAAPVAVVGSSTAATTSNLNTAIQTAMTEATTAAPQVPLALALVETVASFLAVGGRWVVSCGTAVMVPASTQSWIVRGDTMHHDDADSELRVFDDSSEFLPTLVYVPEEGARAIETVGSLPHEPAPIPGDADDDYEGDDSLDLDCGAQLESSPSEFVIVQEDLDVNYVSSSSVAIPTSSSNQREAETAPLETEPASSHVSQPQDDDAPSPPAPVPSRPKWRGQKDLVSVQAKREVATIPQALRGCFVKLNQFTGWVIAELRPRAQAARVRAREFADNWDTAEAVEMTKIRLKTVVRHVIFLLCFFSV